MLLQGKWTGESFKVKEALGEGANGAVFLVYTARGLAALKVCQGAPEVALEWSTLEQLAHLPGFPQPMLIDDCEWNGRRHFFYVMEWIPGVPFDVAYHQLGSRSVSCTVQWLTRLDELHRFGKAFCDLKPQNVLVTTAATPSVRFVDVGGVTPFGRSVRQFTPNVDRAFWGIGGRTADRQYDLVAVALSLIQLELPAPADFHRYAPDERKRWLDKALKKYPGSKRATVLGDVLAGRIADARGFADRWSEASHHERHNRAQTAPTGALSSKRSLKAASSLGAQHRHKSAHRDWSEWLMWCSLSLAVVVTGAAWATAVGWTP